MLIETESFLFVVVVVFLSRFFVYSEIQAE